MTTSPKKLGENHEVAIVAQPNGERAQKNWFNRIKGKIRALPALAGVLATLAGGMDAGAMEPSPKAPQGEHAEQHKDDHAKDHATDHANHRAVEYTPTVNLLYEPIKNQWGGEVTFGLVHPLIENRLEVETVLPGIAFVGNTTKKYLHFILGGFELERSLNKSGSLKFYTGPEAAIDFGLNGKSEIGLALAHPIGIHYVKKNKYGFVYAGIGAKPYVVRYLTQDEDETMGEVKSLSRATDMGTGENNTSASTVESADAHQSHRPWGFGVYITGQGGLVF